MPSRVVRAALVGVWALVASCLSFTDEGVYANEGPCAGGCDVGRACLDGRCVIVDPAVPCLAQDDCRSGEHCGYQGDGSCSGWCEGGLCVGGTCFALDPGGSLPCANDDGCDARLRCEGSVCVPRAGRRCIPGDAPAPAGAEGGGVADGSARGSITTIARNLEGISEPVVGDFGVVFVERGEDAQQAAGALTQRGRAWLARLDGTGARPLYDRLVEPGAIVAHAGRLYWSEAPDEAYENRIATAALDGAAAPVRLGALPAPGRIVNVAAGPHGVMWATTGGLWVLRDAPVLLTPRTGLFPVAMGDAIVLTSCDPSQAAGGDTVELVGLDGKVRPLTADIPCPRRPLVLDDGGLVVTSMVLRGADVSAGRLYLVGPDGGSRAILETSAFAIDATTDGRRVYYFDEKGLNVLDPRDAAPTPRQVVDAPSSVFRSPRIFGGRAYWSEQEHGTVMTAPLVEAPP